MAEPGDPEKPESEKPENDASDHESSPLHPTPSVTAPHDHDPDDLIGFTSPSALAGRKRPAAGVAPVPASGAEEDPKAVFEPAPERAWEPLPEPIFAPEEPVFVRSPEQTPPPAIESVVDPEPDLFEPRPRPAYAERPSEPIAPEPPAPVVAATPAWAIETPPPLAASRTFGRADTPAEPPEGAMGLYTIYALILFAVPTLGVSALIALFAITGRSAPRQTLALSHHSYQKRTLWISAIAALLGVVLIAVNLGVFVLFLLAVWVVVRGAAGILALSANRPIKRPRAWLI